MTYKNFLELFENDQQDTYYTRALYTQAIHETGNFTSKIFRETSNMFGMRPSKKRHKYYKEIATYGSGQYASYESYTDSLADRIDLDKNFRRNIHINSFSQLQDFMHHVQLKGYATAPNYIPVWLKVYKQTFPIDNPITEDNDDYVVKKGKHMLMGIPIALIILISLYFKNLKKKTNDEEK